jgi:hypothetical protein
MATPIKSLFPPIEKKPFLLNKQKKAGAVARRRVSTYSTHAIRIAKQREMKNLPVQEAKSKTVAKVC